jgi:uncharacterized protein
MSLIDASAYVGEWPFRRLPCASPDALLRKMDTLGIERAVVSRLENVFFKDQLAGNRELHDIVQPHPDRFIPAYTINPAFPGWQDDLQICIDDLGMRYLRLHPNYHQYDLLGPQSVALLEQAQSHRFVVLLTLGLEDPRTHHPLVRVANVSTADAADTVNAFPQLRFLIAGGNFSEANAVWRQVDKRENLHVETARVQGPIEDVEKLCRTLGAEHLLFGTNSPLTRHESPKMSLDDAAISDAERQQIASANARRLFEI